MRDYGELVNTPSGWVLKIQGYEITAHFIALLVEAYKESYFLTFGEYVTFVHRIFKFIERLDRESVATYYPFDKIRFALEVNRERLLQDREQLMNVVDYIRSDFHSLRRRVSEHRATLMPIFPSAITLFDVPVVFT